MITRIATDDEQEAVEALAVQDKEVHEFKYLWRLYRNWGKNNPIVASAETHDEICGFHAATFGKRNHYVNSYYQFVLPKYRGAGVGGMMVACLLTTAGVLNCTRLKFKVPFGSMGQRFWNGFELTPFGRDEKHFLYDVDISEAHTPSDLKEAPCNWQSIPEKVLQRYVNNGVEVIT